MTEENYGLFYKFLRVFISLLNAMFSLGEIIFCRGLASPGVPPALLFGRAKRKFCRKPDRHHQAADFHAPALHRTGSYPAAGGGGRSQSPEKKLSPHIGNRAIHKGLFPAKHFCTPPLLAVFESEISYFSKN